MLTRPLTTCLLVLACLSVGTRDASACLCGGLGNPCAALWADDREPVLFEGTVESIERRVIDIVLEFNGETRLGQREMKEVRFRDVRPMLGQRVNTVLTGMGGGDCGYERFAVGARFVVHATAEREGLSTGTCSFTAPVAEAREILDYVATLFETSDGARIDGKVVLAKREFVGLPSTSSSPLTGVRLQLEGPVRRAAVSDARGQYHFAALPVGRYEVTLATERTDLFRLGPMRETVELRHPRACAMPYAEFYANGGVSGSVVDGGGRPVANARVSLRAADIAGQEQVGYDGATTNAEGRYQFKALGAGRYAVGVNIEWGMRKDSPWIPAVASDERGAPAIVALAHAQQVEAPPIVARMPEPALVTGRLMRRNGQPVTQAQVRATSAGEGYRLFGDGVEALTDDDGHFEFTLAAGQAYRISSWRDSSSVEVDTRVTPGMSLTLVLQPRR